MDGVMPTLSGTSWPAYAAITVSDSAGRGYYPEIDRCWKSGLDGLLPDDKRCSRTCKPPQGVTGESTQSEQGTALRDPTPPLSAIPGAGAAMYPRQDHRSTNHQQSGWKHHHPNLKPPRQLACLQTPAHLSIMTYKENIRKIQGAILVQVVLLKLWPQLKLSDDDDTSCKMNCPYVP